MKNLFRNQLFIAADFKNAANAISRSSDTMYSVTYRTNLSLSKMADHKAHLLIGLNVFLLSFFIAKKHLGVLAKLHGYLIPNLFLIFSCVVSIILASMVVKPTLSTKKKSTEKINWLFFSDFQHFSIEEYEKAMAQLRINNKIVHEAMSRDMYWMGVSLAKKYRLLTTAYRVFVYCQLTTLVVYALCFFIHFWHIN